MKRSADKSDANADKKGAGKKDDKNKKDEKKKGNNKKNDKGKQANKAQGNAQNSPAAANGNIPKRSCKCSSTGLREGCANFRTRVFSLLTKLS